MTTPADDFTIQYAIRMPDGSLARTAMYGGDLLWPNRAAAEQALAQLAAHAASLGVRDWAGVVVHRYCTPFIGDTDPAETLVDELSAWLKQQSGEPN